ncbi:hypothetical protein P171DRAFT_506491 [Karstenula rhodostoma CBS 690.94]|uniref:AAA+ ATPase domain-containing protein n=1 Tax=Karstenula rhodostoma CBS 690.94 TaxID=1392251 RepID=A0A9P4P5Z8_9PLEO|nr:hypothetical protein P171DRAFT_506491 [Karstenula rhodostoma CBS 690.94]
MDRLISSPFFSLQSLTDGIKARSRPPPQYGLMAKMSPEIAGSAETATPHQEYPDKRLFFNVTAPSSIFICGSQGSGKSHTLSCLLENCLTPSDAAVLPKPLSAILFHYDTFISDDGGSPCEAAFLSSLPGARVRVVCAPTNIRTIRRTYEHLGVDIEPLQVKDGDLNTKRILDLMAIKSEEGSIPLYVHTVNRILREMRLDQQATGAQFNYQNFKSAIQGADLTPAQLAPLNQRLASLESFMPRMEQNVKGKKLQVSRGTSWENKPGLLTIVDLSCPCISPETACSLFNICLSLFLEQGIDCGRVIALDEAHKYMTGSPESSVLTNTLLSTVRLQRHLGVRVFVSTQEPTIAPAFLDLCSVTVIHRFSSPAWMRSLASHVALLQQQSSDSVEQQEDRVNSLKETTNKLFEKIVCLETGEALLFAASAMPAMSNSSRSSHKEASRSYVKVKVRARLSEDGGRSSFAV